jgi:hypothetical protein
MSHAICRMYDSQERATAAAQELRRNPFKRFTEIHVLTRNGGPIAEPGQADLPLEGIVAALMKAMILKSEAQIYARGILRGGTLVCVHAPFGSALTATQVLDKYGPIDSGYTEPREELLQWDEATPCSSALRMPVLLPDSATFSRFWNVPPLIKGGVTTSSSIGLPELKRSTRNYAPSIPLPLLSKRGTWLSSMLGLPLLTKPKQRTKF